MEPTVIKSTPKTYQMGYIDAFGDFSGITIKGSNLTYDPVTGLLTGGTVGWIIYETYDFSGTTVLGKYTLSNLSETDVATLNATGLNWTQATGFFEFYATQSGATMSLDATGEDFFLGTEQDDVITVDLNNYFFGTIDAGMGNDIVRGASEEEIILGGGGDDRLYGGRGTDTLYGGQGDDLLYGGDHDDWLYGDDGADRIYGGAGNDWILGDQQGYGGADNPNAGNDFIDGGAGHDIITANGGDDRVKGGLGDDSIWGGAGNDRLYGGDGNDDLYGGDPTQDRLGDNKIYGDAGDDRMIGSLGNDTLYGGIGNDVLTGNAGNDVLFGGDGNDLMGSYESGHDILSGGAGADHFVFHAATSETARITDFNAAEDLFSIQMATDTTQQDQYDLFLAGAVQQNQHVVWSDANITILLSHLNLDDITLANFVDTGGDTVATY